METSNRIYIKQCWTVIVVLSDKWMVKTVSAVNALPLLFLINNKWMCCAEITTTFSMRKFIQMAIVKRKFQFGWQAIYCSAVAKWYHSRRHRRRHTHSSINNLLCLWRTGTVILKTKKIYLDIVKSLISLYTAAVIIIIESSRTMVKSHKSMLFQRLFRFASSND